MERQGTEKAERVADMLYSVLRLVILIVIIPSALLLAVFYLLTPLIPNILIRALASVFVGVGLAGLLLTKLGRIRIGSVLLVASASSASTSIVLSWNALHITFFCLHGLLIFILIVIKNLGEKKVISEERIESLYYLLGISTIITGSSAIAFTLLFFMAPVLLALAVLSLALMFYFSIAQYLLKDPRLGLLNAFLFALTSGFIGVHLCTGFSTDSLFLGSSFSLSFGIGLLSSSQIARKIQDRIYYGSESLTERDRIQGYFEVIETLSGERPIITAIEWVMDDETAHTLSGIALIIMSSAIPSLFLWFSGTTGWGSNPWFLLLMVPLAIIFALLTSAPSPVLFRLGGRIKRDTEGKLVRLIGLIIVLTASSALFLWTQYFYWHIALSLVSSSFLILTGVTGLFRSIRYYWRQAWLLIVKRLRIIKKWIFSHPIHVGILVDACVTAIIVIIARIWFEELSGSYLSLPALAAVCFTGFGLTGLVLMKNIPKRQILVSLGLLSFLFSLAIFTLWWLVYILLFDLLSAIGISSGWLLFSAVLQRLGVTRQRVSLFYVPAAFTVLSIVVRTELAVHVHILMIFLSAFILFAPVLHPEYKIAGSYLNRALVWFGHALYNGLIRLANLLMDFILISGAVGILLGSSILGFQFIAPSLNMDFISTITFLAIMFFILYTPLLNWQNRSNTLLMWASVFGLAVSSGVFTFLILTEFHLALRLAIAFLISSLVLTFSKELLPLNLRSFLIPITWTLILSGASIWIYLLNFPIIGFISAASLSIFLFGIGLLPFRIKESYAELSGKIYLLLSIPSGAVGIYSITQNLFLTIIVAILIPLPVEYKLYVRIATKVTEVTLLAVRYILLILAIHLVLIMGVFAITVSLFIVQYLTPILLANPFAPLLFVLAFLVLFSLVWIPVLHLRRHENTLLLSSVSLIFSAALSFNLAILFYYLDTVQLVLVSFSLFGILLFFLKPDIHFLRSRKFPATLALGCLILLSIYLVPLDLISRLILAGLGYSILSIIHLEKRTLIRISYPIATGCFIGYILWHVFLLFGFPLLIITGFISLESLLLSIPNEIKSRWTWWIFSVSSGAIIFQFLSFVWLTGFALAILVILELVKVTPDSKLVIERFELSTAVVRASLLAIASVNPLFFLMDNLIALEIGVTIFLAILTLSLRQKTDEYSLYGLSTSTCFSISILIFSHLLLVLRTDVFIAFYIGIIPILLFFHVRAYSEPFARLSWRIFGLCGSIGVSLLWIGLYRSIESLTLVAITGIFIFLMFQSWFPKAGFQPGRIIFALGISFIVFLEVLWLWHSILILSIPSTSILIGSALLLLSTLILPFTGSIDPGQFEKIWIVVSVSVGISVSALITGWDLAALVMPMYPIQTTGLALLFFSVTCTPLFILSNEQHAYLTWFPSLPGMALLGAQTGFFLWSDLRLILSLTALSFCLAAAIMMKLAPQDTSFGWLVLDLILATVCGGIIWALGETIIDYSLLLVMSSIIWYIVTLPFSLAPTLWALSWMIKILKRFFVYVALVFPPLVGIFIGIFFYNPIVNDSMFGLGARSYLVSSTVFFTVTAFLYLIESKLVNRSISVKLREIVLILFSIAVYRIVFLFGVPHAYCELIWTVFLYTTSSALALLTSVIFSYAYNLTNYTRNLHLSCGFFIALAMLSGLTVLGSWSIVSAVPASVLISLTFVAPLYPEQVRRIADGLRKLGSVLATAIRKGIYEIIESFRTLATYLHYLFNRWGYVMWSLFSISFTFGLGFLTYPFFSELIFMSPSSILYPIPSFSIPIALLGLLLFTIAIIRRKVKRTFGSISVMIALAGLWITSTVALIDYGFLLFSFSGFVASICILGILVQRVRMLDRIWLTRFWSPLPVCLIPIFMQFTILVESSLIIQVFTFILSLLPIFCLYLLSTKYELIPSEYQNPLWIVIAFVSSAITYVASILGSVPLYPALYLSIIVGSIISYPAVTKNTSQLFIAIFFFALTGFAFSFIFAPFYQSLLPATSAALLFVSRFIREKESEIPRLVYARIIVLLILIASLALFGISIAISMPTL
jgi:hypothetical protein